MSLEQSLKDRSESKCELCSAENDLSVFVVPPETNPTVDTSIIICETCKSQIENPSSMDANHWRCLNDSMWSQIPAVQVMAWRLLNSLKSEGWPQDLLDMMYLEDETKKWAMAGVGPGADNDEPTLDVNGTALNNGDSVTLVKDLVIQGANFTAKRGTLVKGISLTDDTSQIEGRINGTRIVLRASYMKKA
ncbi:alkylphosphonate utilization protein [Cocleimonas flava]|uniref:Protein PhnA n=1 Tax=Cocleimonas flava TaxID=634765 RepID=A0A4R1F4V2_9GAMM|nr:alkylphosphonate utilization protein [Cocleimonas flava]TCJ89287.1 protein PhnA [Cocleimonas flava]